MSLVYDHLTHTYARTFPPAEARRLARRVQLVFTPRHGSWLNTAEPELSLSLAMITGVIASLAGWPTYEPSRRRGAAG